MIVVFSNSWRFDDEIEVKFLSFLSPPSFQRNSGKELTIKISEMKLNGNKYETSNFSKINRQFFYTILNIKKYNE